MTLVSQQLHRQVLGQVATPVWDLCSNKIRNRVTRGIWGQVGSRVKDRLVDCEPF
jgi:hypothetical protein